MELVPNENPTPADADALLAKEMNQLTVEERNNVLNDIHGIVDDPEHHAEVGQAQQVDNQDGFTTTTPQHVASGGGQEAAAAAAASSSTMMDLDNSFSTTSTSTFATNLSTKERSMDFNALVQQMQEEINKFFYKPAYNTALLSNSQFVKDPELWYHILRVKHYNVKDAANLLIKFFEAKLELFGASKLVSKITMDDIESNPHDKLCLESGCIQLLPNLSDRAGRAILCYFPSLQPNNTPIESVVRIYIYIYIYSKFQGVVVFFRSCPMCINLGPSFSESSSHAFISFLLLYSFRHVKQQLRVFWYATMCAYENEDIQRRGQVLLVFNNTNIVSESSPSSNNTATSNEPAVTIDRPAIWGIGRLTTYLPMRLTALHYTYQDDCVKPIVALMQMAVGTYQRLRMRSHQGLLLENLMKLRDFGIPTEILPISCNAAAGGNGGTVTMKLHETFVEGRQQLERQTFEKGLLSVLDEDGELFEGFVTASIVTDDNTDESGGRVTPVGGPQQQEQPKVTNNNNNGDSQPQDPPAANVPGRFDVLLGVRGKASLQHPGNSRYCHIVEMNWPAYEEAAKYQKLEIADRVIETVRSSGGRFLKLEDTQWIEMDDDTILREKVAHAFRNIRRRKQQKGK